MTKVKTDYEIIKDNYGEAFAKFCREYFSTILITPGLLSRILLDNFADNHWLLDDIVKNKKVEEFKNFIFYTYFDYINKQELEDAPKHIVETPEVLMEKAGYILYKCETKEDIDRFKKYYKSGEELCTFRDEDRLDDWVVYFAVKKNVEEIRREDFTNPKRQDAYGTSVISIQFTRGENSIISIKNRYNHTVQDPDATFSNDLENIYPGLTESFEVHHGISFMKGSKYLDLGGYVLASDGKRYPYNYEVANIYFCPNNIIIRNGEVIKLDKSRYEMFDYFIFDKVEKKFIKLHGVNDSFTDGVENVQKIETFVDKNTKERTLKITFIDSETNETKYFIVTTNERGQMVRADVENCISSSAPYLRESKELSSLRAPNITYLPNDSIKHAKLKVLSLESVEEIDSYCFTMTKYLEEINCPNLRRVGDNSFLMLESLRVLDIPKCDTIGSRCFLDCFSLEELSLPRVTSIGSNSFPTTYKLRRLNLPLLQSLGNSCFKFCNELEELSAPNLERIFSYCFEDISSLKVLNLPKVREVMQHCFMATKSLEELCMDSCTSMFGKNFMNAEKLHTLRLDKLHSLGVGCFYSTLNLEELNLPCLESIAKECFRKNRIKRVNLPRLDSLDSYSFSDSQSLEEFNAPRLRKMNNMCLTNANNLRQLDVYNLQEMGDSCLQYVDSLKVAILPYLKRMGSYCFSGASSLEVFRSEHLEEIPVFSLINAPNLSLLKTPSLINIGSSSLTNSHNINSAVVSTSINPETKKLLEEKVKSLSYYNPYIEDENEGK